MEDYFIDPNGSDLLDPKLDPIFKALFTSNTEESKGALLDFLSVFIGKVVVEVVIISNESAIKHRNQKQIRYDFSCKFNDGELATVEMALKQRADELVRSEYYLAESFTSQENKGKGDYDNLKRAYQITLLAEGKKFDDGAFLHNFEYYDKKNQISLGGKTKIITLEMAKINEKDLSQLDDTGIWGFFLKYANDKSKIDLIEDIGKQKEGIKMATKALGNISKSQEMRLEAIRAQKKIKDYLSDMAMSRREGREEGRAEGRVEGEKIGETRGEKNAKLATARVMLSKSFSIELISEITGLSIEEIEELTNMDVLN